MFMAMVSSMLRRCNKCNKLTEEQDLSVVSKFITERNGCLSWSVKSKDYLYCIKCYVADKL
jgi:hypothetical protein